MNSDIICNWYGGQNASLELARLVPGYRDNFPAAGYAGIVVNDSYVGGHVRQYGNLSFSRIFDAGHTVPFYQPETAFTVFSRIIQGDDISMGHNINLSTYRTEGIPDSIVHTNKIPPIPALTCWIRDLGTCNQEQVAAIGRGEGVVNAGIWSPAPDPAPVGAASGSSKPPLQSKTAYSIPTTTVPLTGVFTATATPLSIKSGASRNTPSLFTRWGIDEIRLWDESRLDNIGRAKKIDICVIVGLTAVGAAFLGLDLRLMLGGVIRG